MICLANINDCANEFENDKDRIAFLLNIDTLTAIDLVMDANIEKVSDTERMNSEARVAKFTEVIDCVNIFVTNNDLVNN